MAKIYTKTGDTGETGLYAGPRVRKNDARIEAFGAVDELNSLLGVARATGLSDDVDGILRRVQNELFAVGAELATPDPSASGTDMVGDESVAALEADIDQFESTLVPLQEFILPAGVQAAATLHLARTVCRRAERRVITLADHLASADSAPGVSPCLVRYLNRLSDLLFVLGRHVNSVAGSGDVPWEKP